MKNIAIFCILMGLAINQKSQGQSPLINMISNSKACKGYVFIATLHTTVVHPNHLLVLDNSGKIVIDKTLPSYLDGNFTDFKPQQGNRYSFFNQGDYMYYIMDKDFNIIDKITAANDHLTDAHDFLITKDNHYWLMATEHKMIDMTDSVNNGFSGTNVTGWIIQELDSNKKLLFEWKTFDHLRVMDCVGQNMATSTVDYAHCNSIDLDTDSTLILSSRHLNELTKINIKTGKIVWRMGKNAVENQFKFINDSLGFSYQHDARRLPNGNITLFDNGNLRSGTRYSRACEYKIDEVNKTAELVWQYRHSPDVVSDFMGNVQRLPNGNTLIGWGGTFPSATEVDSLGNEAMEVSFPSTSRTFSYRVFKYDIEGLGSSSATQNMQSKSQGPLLYPNPSNGIFTVDTKSNTPVLLGIYNISGQLVMQKTIIGQQSISVITSGVYTAIFSSNGNRTVQRFVVE